MSRYYALDSLKIMKALCDFQYCHIAAIKAPRSGRGHFLPYPFQSISHLIMQRNVVKTLNASLNNCTTIFE